MQGKKLIVIGGGAAGFFCAVNAARMHPGLRVTVLERSSKLLSKVRISGGGRCNVTHACFSISDMIRKYPRGASFLKKSFHHFFTTDTVEWFESRGVPLKTEDDGRMFPASNDSKAIIDCLLTEAAKYKIDIRMNAEVQAIRVTDPVDKNLQQLFEIQCRENLYPADFVCVACGGFSRPSQFEWLTLLGHNFEPPVPSLFTLNIPGDKITSLMGITVEHTSVKFCGTKLQQEGPLLITHWGMSGPAVLKLSAWGAREFARSNYDCRISVNWVPAFNENTLKEKLQQLRFAIASQKIVNRNPFFLPSRLWEYLLDCCSISENMRWADLPAREQNKLVKILCSHEFHVKGKTTFKEEFVTAGGIKPGEVDAGTMESRIIPGLYFAGEILDIDGVTGGFNFQNAWTTGWIAGNLRSAR